eukprot:263845_1
MSSLIKTCPSSVQLREVAGDLMVVYGSDDVAVREMAERFEALNEAKTRSFMVPTRDDLLLLKTSFCAISKLTGAVVSANRHTVDDWQLDVIGSDDAIDRVLSMVKTCLPASLEISSDSISFADEPFFIDRQVKRAKKSLQEKFPKERLFYSKESGRFAVKGTPE